MAEVGDPGMIAMRTSFPSMRPCNIRATPTNANFPPVAPITPAIFLSFQNAATGGLIQSDRVAEPCRTGLDHLRASLRVSTGRVKQCQRADFPKRKLTPDEAQSARGRVAGARCRT